MRTYTQIEVANILTNVMKDITCKRFLMPIDEPSEYIRGYFEGMRIITEDVVNTSFDYIYELTCTEAEESIETKDDFDEKGAII